VIDLDTAFGQEFLDIAVRQAVPEIPANSQQDHVGREPETSETTEMQDGHDGSPGHAMTRTRSVNATEHSDTPFLMARTVGDFADSHDAILAAGYRASDIACGVSNADIYNEAARGRTGR
jgi:hypothetical protein